MNIQDKIIPSAGGLDLDSSHQSIEKNDYPYMLNLISENGVTENLKGSVLVNNPYLPSGTNITIGKEVDLKENSVFYFVWNSNKNHGIYRLWLDQNGGNGRIDPIAIDPRLNFDKDHLITGTAYINNLLYFTDYYNEQRKINVVKANNVGKQFKNNVYFPKEVLSKWESFTIKLFTRTGVRTATLPYTSTSGGRGTREETIEWLTKKFSELVNNKTSIKNYVTATTCSSFATFTTITPEENIGIIATAKLIDGTIIPLVVVADNYYPSIKKEFIDRIKYPFTVEPTTTFKTDEVKKLNLIQNKTFQFRTKLVYDDYEKSTWGPISVLPTVPLTCGESSSNNPFNYIEVDYATPRLKDAQSLSIIKRVEIAVREGNTGKFKFVTSLDKEEIIFEGYKYKFYNDGIYNAIADSESIKPYDSIGLLTKSLELVEDRIFDAGSVEGYDGVCLNTKLGVTFEESPSLQTYSFTGKVFIRNIFGKDTKYAMYQPIHNTGDGVGFGGFAGSDGGVDLLANDVENDYITDYKQSLELNGFVFYLAGTPHHAITKQKIGYSSDIQDGATGVYNSKKGEGRWSLTNPSNGSNRQKIRYNIEKDDNYVYSLFTISGVPKGKYILRVASHLTTHAQLNAGNLDYQNTSTNTIAVGGREGGECEIEILDGGVIMVNGVRQADTNIPISEIADLTNAADFTNDSMVLSGYVTDKDIQPEPTGAARLNDTRIELAEVLFSKAASSNIAIGANATKLKNNWSQKRTYTDHNGYFFYGVQSSNFGALTVEKIKSGPYELTPSMYGLDGSVWDGSVVTAMAKSGVFRNTNNNVSLYSRTKITGLFTYNGVKIGGVSIVNRYGSVGVSGSDGFYSIYTYASTEGGSSQARSGSVYFTMKDGCIATFQHNSLWYSVTINPSNYNTTNTYNINNTILALIGSIAASSLKRGGQYKKGLVYFDDAGRSCFVQHNDSLNLYIPFNTEKKNGITIGKGKPVVNWEILHSAPVWATKYQWVRTQNSKQGRYIQFVAKSVRYIDKSGTNTAYASAVEVDIDMSNINIYNDRHVDSKLSYVYEEGDVMVPVRDENGNFFSDYFEFKIKGNKTGAEMSLYIDKVSTAAEIKEGCLFEIYNPQKDQEIEFFYEQGETFDILTDHNGIKVHQGLTSNQKTWRFTDNTYVDGFVGFKSNVKHNLVVGDTITITQDPGYVVEAYNRELQVTRIVNDYTIATGLSFTTSTPVNPGTVTVAAKGTFRNGDTWTKVRTMVYNDGRYEKSSIIEDASISDFYNSKVESIGRPHIINKDGGQRELPTMIRFSNRIIEGSKINGLSSVEALNQKQLPTSHGLIQKLILAKDTLIAICENSEMLSMYINKDELQHTNGGNLIALSDKVISQTYNYGGSFGTQNPESVDIDEDYRVYGVDRNKGVVWMRTTNGVEPISELKARTWVDKKCTELRNVTSPKIVAVWDPYKKQYIISFPNINKVAQVVYNPTKPTLATATPIKYPVTEIVTELKPTIVTVKGATQLSPSTAPALRSETPMMADSLQYTTRDVMTTAVAKDRGVIMAEAVPVRDNTVVVGTAVVEPVSPVSEMPIETPGETIAFTRDKKRWETFYSFLPEFYVNGRNKEMIAFLNGKAWRHHKNPLHNNFFGIQYSYKIGVCFNQTPSHMKGWMKLSLEAKDEWFAPKISTPSGQESELIVEDFTKMENVFHADFLRDKNSPVEKPLIFGDELLGETIEVNLEGTKTYKTSIYAINGYAITSESTNK